MPAHRLTLGPSSPLLYSYSSGLCIPFRINTSKSEHPTRMYVLNERSEEGSLCNSFRMRTYKSEHPTRMRVLNERSEEGSLCNSFRMRTYKSVSKHVTLSPFRMNTYENPREGVVPHSHRCSFASSTLPLPHLYPRATTDLPLQGCGSHPRVGVRPQPATCQLATCNAQLPQQLTSCTSLTSFISLLPHRTSRNPPGIMGILHSFHHTPGCPLWHPWVGVRPQPATCKPANMQPATRSCLSGPPLPPSWPSRTLRATVRYSQSAPRYVLLETTP